MASSYSIGYGSTQLNNMVIYTYGLTISQGTIFATIASLAFVMTAPVAGFVLSRKCISRRALMFVGMIILAISNFFRSGEFGAASPNFWIWFSMQGLSGVGLAINFCTTLPELVETIERQKKLSSQIDPHLRDIYLSTVLVFSSGLASGCGMLTSLTVVGFIGYKFTFILGGCILLCFLALYAFLCGLSYDLINEESETSDQIIEFTQQKQD